ncbi:amino acid adenylation domain-containing protein, partial [Seinonella peptonophila]
MVMEDLQDLYELTPAQQGILFHALYEENMGVYLNQICFTLRGEVDLPVYQQAWRTAIDKFSVLRTAFMWEELQQPLQIVWQRADLPWHEEDWRSYSSAQQEKKWQQLMQEDRRRGFSLDRPPLMRISIIRMDEEQYQVLWTFHHLILDGWSFSLLLQETCYYYQQLLQQQCVEEIPEQSFRDYVAWIQQQDQASAERFWKERLATVTEPTFLPVQPNRYLSESQPSMLFATFEEWLDEEWTKQLEEVARRHQLTLNTWIQGAWALLLNRYTSQEQVLFGTTVSGRPVDLDRFESMIGMFINTLPSLVRVEPGKTVLDWLKELQQQQAEAREYEYTSLVDIQSWSQLPQGTSMFESLIAFENYPLEQFHAGNVRIEGLYAVERTNFPFNLLVVPGRRMLFKWSWDRSKFADSAIRRLISHFVHLLQQMIKNPTGLHLEQIQLLYPDELRQFHEWDGEKLPYSQHSMLHHLIEEQVDQAPDQIALIDQAHQITYQELDERANRVAGQLLSSGVLPEERVGICLHRSIDMVVAILGVLKAGAAYVPLDPAYPEERVRYMLEDSAAVVLLTEKSLLNRFSDLELEQYCLDDEMLWLNIPSVRPRLELNPEQLAYIIYTSGSTGKPKGVMIEHRNAVSFISWAHQVFSQQELGGVLAATSICFDLSVFELFAPLSCGGKVIIADDILQLPQLKGRELVTLLNTVPSAMAELLRMEVIPPQVMTVNLAGEPLPTDIVRQLYERESIQHVYNLYGPSEDTTYSTFYLVPKGRELAPAIGRSIANSSAYVLDQYQQLLPIGVPGELYLGGHGVARGYRNQPQLTKEKFIIHSEFGRLYRTGDLVRWNEDGQLEFLGRIDHQVKIRGYRIECGEIEALLRQHEAIHDVVVVARNDVGIGQQLVAYLTGEDHLVDWTEYLRQYIPDYMVPAFFVTLDELPLTPNGKVDRKALPKPQQQGSYSQEELTTVEQLIRDIWKTVLPISPQGKQSHFFQLGGHSLLATRVVARMNEVFQLKMPLRVLFEAPTIEQLAMAVESEMRTAEKTALPTVERVDCSKPIPASFAQQRIWFFERFIPGTSVYQIPYALELNGKLDVAVLASSCQMLTNRHGSLRTTFVEQDGELFQKINEEITLPLTMTDLRVTSDPEIATLQAIQQEMEQGFSLEQGPLFRLHLFRTGEQSWIFFVLFHHIIADGWSLNVFKKELFSIYQDLLVGKEPAIQEEEWQYTDFAVWQRKLSSTGAWQQQLDYWKQKLANTPVLQLPLDHPRSAEQTFTGASFDLSIPNAWIGQLEKLGRTEGATLFMILLAAFQVLLARLSGQNQFAIGSPIANRSQVWMEKCIGFFVNTQVYRTNLSFDWDFRELVAQVRKTALEAYEHQDVPFEQIVDELQPERSLTYSPLFQVMFALQEQNQSFESISNLKVSTFSIPQTTAKFDLSLIVTEEDGEWRGIFEYNSDLFTVETIERMSRLYRQLLQEIIQNPNQSIGKYSFLQPFEQRQLQQWNQTTVPILESNLLAPLWDRVCQHPEAEA